MKSLSDLSVADLRRVLAFKEQIESLEGQLEAIGGESNADAASPAETPVPVKRTKRRLSAAHRRKLIKALAKARKIRWAKATGNRHGSKETPHEHGGTRCHISRSQGAMGQSPCGKSLTL